MDVDEIKDEVCRRIVDISGNTGIDVEYLVKELKSKINLKNPDVEERTMAGLKLMEEKYKDYHATLGGHIRGPL